MDPFISLSPPFSPKVFGCQLWLNARDSSSITSSAGKVSQWNDLSGFGTNSTQGTGASQPSTGVNNINGNNVITFNNTYLTTGTGNIVTGDALSLYVVARTTSVTVRNSVYSTRGTNAAGSWQFEMGITDIGGTVTGLTTVSTPGNYLAATPGGVIAANTAYVLCYDRDTSLDNTLYVNNTSEPVTLGSNISFVTNSANKLIGMGTNQNLNPFKGDIGELILFPYSLNQMQNLIVISYLKQAWGL